MQFVGFADFVAQVLKNSQKNSPKILCYRLKKSKFAG
jgi:hypothetical protein